MMPCDRPLMEGDLEAARNGVIWPRLVWTVWAIYALDRLGGTALADRQWIIRGLRWRMRNTVPKRAAALDRIGLSAPEAGLEILEGQCDQILS